MVEAYDVEVRALHRALLDAWNRQDASAMARLFAPGGALVGFDGSQVDGRETIEAHLSPIFASQPTPAYVAVVRDVRPLGPEAAILRAVAGMIPRGESHTNPDLNAVQSLIASRTEDGWEIALFQNTPAALHGRPEEAESLTHELRAAAH